MHMQVGSTAFPQVSQTINYLEGHKYIPLCVRARYIPPYVWAKCESAILRRFGKTVHPSNKAPLFSRVEG
ncbi:hypothetical protein BABINDRAFT_163386 [Babjeviella inositovora NRRL Y-12698]|uniref:Uncharacterized protein n=1 Tax=Babjeviella inositovora NRRL Y-12698 TaxID=984486 RepID=A0A1E3QJ03_9ASCO|nr:uncharacterized protein BABINDRAFT_163386 [Babjeviella inositovora NRRL Y-12698]ODQ77675.1 hypothetical protein BABINDRAFT_163386 [Babjeviella inositovora NRRL Y-12698]